MCACIDFLQGNIFVTEGIINFKTDFVEETISFSCSLWTGN